MDDIPVAPSRAVAPELPAEEGRIGHFVLTLAHDPDVTMTARVAPLLAQ